jgi:hypothetical protein
MHTTEKFWEAVFSVESVQRPYLQNQNTVNGSWIRSGSSLLVRKKRILASSSQWRTDMARSQTLARDCSHEELVVGQAPGSEDQSRGTRMVRNPQHWKALPGDNLWRHSRLKRLSVCCSELQSVYISDSTIVSCRYEFQKSSKSDYQSKPHL